MFGLVEKTVWIFFVCMVVNAINMFYLMKPGAVWPPCAVAVLLKKDVNAGK